MLLLLLLLTVVVPAKSRPASISMLCAKALCALVVTDAVATDVISIMIVRMKAKDLCFDSGIHDNVYVP